MSVESIKTKSAVVDEIKAKLEGAESVVVIDYIGTTVEQATAMRAKLREADVDYTVYKNTMIARAIEGTAFEGLKDSLEGPSALAISKSDAVAPARVINSAIKEYGKMAFKAGYVEGILYDAEGLTQISWSVVSTFSVSTPSNTKLFPSSVSSSPEKEDGPAAFLGYWAITSFMPFRLSTTSATASSSLSPRPIRS